MNQIHTCCVFGNRTISETEKLNCRFQMISICIKYKILFFDILF